LVGKTYAFAMSKRSYHFLTELSLQIKAKTLLYSINGIALFKDDLGFSI